MGTKQEGDYIMASGIHWGLLSRVASSGMGQKERRVWPEAAALTLLGPGGGPGIHWTGPTVMQKRFLGWSQSQDLFQGSARLVRSPETGDGF